jgi:hypothetical protein
MAVAAAHISSIRHGIAKTGDLPLHRSRSLK